MFKVFIFFTAVVFLYIPQLAFSLSEIEQHFHNLSTPVSAEEARAIEEEMHFRRERAIEEEMRRREEQLADQSGIGFHSENIDQVKGVMITFTTYPVTEEQKTLLVEKLNKEGLKEDAEIQRFKMWIYNWENIQEGMKAEMLCKELLAFSFIEDCKASAVVHPEYSVDIVKRAEQMVQSAEKRLKRTEQWVKRADERLKKVQEKVVVREKNVKEAEQWVKNAEQKLQTARNSRVASRIASAEKRLLFYKKWLEGREKWLANSERWVKNRKKWLEKTKEWLERDKKWLESRKQWLNRMKNALANKTKTPPKAPAQTPSTPPSEPPSESNLKTCNIISHKLNRYHVFSYTQKKKAPLSDYWAQEMIGADLLKKEMQDLPPIKKHFIQLFDVNIPKGPAGHDHVVQNLIADDGKHSVLPKLGENSIGINHTHTTGDMVKYSDEMLSKAEKKCSHLKPAPPSRGSVGQGGSLR